MPVAKQAPRGRSLAPFVSSRCSRSGPASPRLCGHRSNPGPGGQQEGRHRRRPVDPRPLTTGKTPSATRPTPAGASLHRDLQPVRHVDQGQERGAGRKHPDLSRSRQRVSEPLRVLPEVHEGRLRPQRHVGKRNSNVKYWGEYYIDRDIQMAPNAVVILARLCYASGKLRVGRRNPTKSTAIKRVDNYGFGFLHAGGVFLQRASPIRATSSRTCTRRTGRCARSSSRRPTGRCRTASTSSPTGRRGPRRRWIHTSRVVTTARSSGSCR